MNNIKPEITYENVYSSINNIFDNVEKDIKDFIYKIYKIKSRTTKVSFKSALIYSLLYTKIDGTKSEIVNELIF